MITYGAILVVLFFLEIVYFRIADRFNIIDKPNQRSSHSRVVLRGGGIIFTIALWVWSIMSGFEYPWLLAGVTLAAGISFVDDIHSLPDSLRLVVQFVSMILVFAEIFAVPELVEGPSAVLRQAQEPSTLAVVEPVETSQLWQWLIMLFALIVAVAGTNIFNFMDGINGITGGYSLAVLIPLFLLNRSLDTLGMTSLGMTDGSVISTECNEWRDPSTTFGMTGGFMDETMLIVIGLSVLVFCFFNFRKKAKCFAGDVGSIGMALMLVFCIGRLMYVTGDVSWIVLYLIYGVDGMMTILHRIMLHENLGQAHRKHAYQLMANELKMPHVAVSTIYMVLQLAVSLIAIYVIPDTILAHWIYLIAAALIMAGAYIIFMRKYYHLHEAYLKGLSPSTNSCVPSVASGKPSAGTAVGEAVAEPVEVPVEPQGTDKK